MWLAIFSLTLLGTLLGLVLGVAAKRFHVEGNSLAAEIEALMPGSNCGQCGSPVARARPRQSPRAAPR